MEISGHKYFAITILTICGHVTFKWQQGSVVVELDWPHSIARPPKPFTRCKDLGNISYRIRIMALLSQILLPWQPGRAGAKFHWRHSMAKPGNPPIDAKISQISLAQAEF